jgi:hypothetical protein
MVESALNVRWIGFGDGGPVEDLERRADMTVGSSGRAD